MASTCVLSDREWATDKCEGAVRSWDSSRARAAGSRPPATGGVARDKEAVTLVRESGGLGTLEELGQDGERQCGPDTVGAAAVAGRKHATGQHLQQLGGLPLERRQAVSPRSPECGGRDRHARPEPETTKAKGRTGEVES